MGEASGNLDQLRSLAIDYVRASRWADLLTERSRLEQDTEYWMSIWGPSCAVAAFHEGREDARELLDSLIVMGFHDYPTHAGLFAESFATEPDWPDLRARMEANKPPPPMEITEWPCAAPIGVLSIDRLDAAGEALLASRLPAPVVTASETALTVLDWVTSRWRHSSANHVDVRDANRVLDLVEAGGRFACREYTIVLTQALNALGIPARVLALFRDDYYTGMGTGHATTEAWLDDIGGWVVLDGQNGATWRDPDGVLLGVVELQRMLRAGETPAFVGSGPNFDPTSAEEWIVYFKHCSTGGAAWRKDSFIPILEGRSVLESRPLMRSAEAAHPDLAGMSTSIVDLDGAPAALFETLHPFATGFSLVDQTGTRHRLGLNEPSPLDDAPGEHAWHVSTQTRFGELRASNFTYVARQP